MKLDISIRNAFNIRSSRRSLSIQEDSAHGSKGLGIRNAKGLNRFCPLDQLYTWLTRGNPGN